MRTANDRTIDHGGAPTPPGAPRHDDRLAIEPGPIRELRGKRLFDIATAGVVLVVSMPLILVALVASTLSFRASPVFRQQRIGRDGHLFTVLKIRTLPSSTPAASDKYDLASVDTSRIGRLLRRTHLDELPQLLNVVAGSMSIVGPRPEMPALAATYPTEFVARRTQVRPGITGLWQVSTASAGLIGEAPHFDEYYLTHRSWRLDAWILGRTVAKMAFGRTVSFEDVVEARP